MRRGDVVLTILPFTDLSGQKRRPALVISPDTRAGDDVIVVLLHSSRNMWDNRFFPPTCRFLIPILTSGKQS